MRNEESSGGPLPERVWLWLWGSAWLILPFIIAGIGFISAGVFDPPLAGPLQAHAQLAPVTVAAEQTRITALPLTVHTPFSLQMSARLAEGSAETSYGLQFAEDDRQLTLAVSPAGYVRVWQVAGGQTIDWLPWQPWPHVRSGSVINTWWVNGGVEQGSLVVRLNGELLWRARQADYCQSEAGCRVSLWGNSPTGQATLDYREWRLYAPNP